MQEPTILDSTNAVNSLDEFANHMQQWHAKLTMQFATMIASDKALEFEEVDGTTTVATPEQVYGFKRGLTHALELMDLPFETIKVESDASILPE